MRSIPNLRPIDTGSAPKTYGEGRSCTECLSVLSKWNPDPVCRMCHERAKREREQGLLIRPMRGFR